MARRIARLCSTLRAKAGPPRHLSRGQAKDSARTLAALYRHLADAEEWLEDEF